MPIDKQKVSAAAQKYIRKGAWNKAIRELEKLVEADPDDVRTLLKIGNLHSRNDAPEKAVEIYLDVADHYRSGGFYQKAIAVYKQVHKLEPDRIDVWESLGSLYQAQGLTRDALTAYRQVLKHHRDSGDTESYLSALAAVCQIEPENVALRTKYADQLARNDRVDAAISQFETALRMLREAGRHRDFVRVSERLLYFDPQHSQTLKALARFYLDQDEARQALAKLQKLYSLNPREIETLEMLSQAFLALDHTSKALSVLKELGRIYGSEHRDESLAEDAWQRALELAPDDPEVLDALGLDADIPMLDDAAIEPLGPEDGVDAVAESRVSRPKSLTPEQIAEEVDRLLTEFDVCLRYNLLDKARVQLAEIEELDPGNPEARYREGLLLDADGDQDGALEAFLEAAEGVWSRDMDLALAIIGEIAQIDAGHREAYQMVRSWGLDPESYGLQRPSAKPTAPSRSQTTPGKKPSGPPPLPPKQSTATSRTTSPAGVDIDPGELSPVGPARDRGPAPQTLPPDAFEFLDEDARSENLETLDVDEIEELDASLAVEVESEPAGTQHASHISSDPDDEEFSSLFDLDEGDIDSLFSDDFISQGSFGDGGSSLDPFGGGSNDGGGMFGASPQPQSEPSTSEPEPMPQPEPAPPTGGSAQSARTLTVKELSALLEEIAEAEFFIEQGLYDDAESMLRDMRERFGADPRILKVQARLVELRQAG